MFNYMVDHDSRHSCQLRDTIILYVIQNVPESDFKPEPSIYKPNPMRYQGNKKKLIMIIYANRKYVDPDMMREQSESLMPKGMTNKLKNVIFNFV